MMNYVLKIPKIVVNVTKFEHSSLCGTNEAYCPGVSTTALLPSKEL